MPLGSVGPGALDSGVVLLWEGEEADADGAAIWLVASSWNWRFFQGVDESKVARMYALFLLGFEYAAEADDLDQDPRRAMGIESSTLMKICKHREPNAQCALCIALERRLITAL